VARRRRIVRVPASTANLGPGYDILAAALTNELELEVAEGEGFSIVSEGIDVPTDRSNLIVRAFEELHPADDVAFRVRSDIPLARGLGSSASAILAGLLAADHMFELANSRDELFARAAAIEGHPDNVAAALYGSFTLCPPAGPGGAWPTPVRINPPEGVEGILVVSREEMPTEAARAAMPAEIPLADALHNVATAAELVLGLERSDLDLIRSGLADRIHQPRRASLFPRSMELVARAAELGALGATISGAGPTVLVWTWWQSAPGLLADVEAFADGWADVRRAQFSPRGARVELL
jgi:homoserine kinase